MSRGPWKEREKVLQGEVAKLFTLSGAHVYNLSQSRATNQSPGLADLWVMASAVGAAWWMEVKTATGKRTPPQVKFAEECEAAGVGYIVGGLEAAKAKLVAVGLAQIVAGQFTLTPKRVTL